MEVFMMQPFQKQVMNAVCELAVLCLFVLAPNQVLSAGIQNGSVLSPACIPGTGWTWTTGDRQPEVASRVERALGTQGIEGTVVAHGFGEKDSCGNFELFSSDVSVTLKGRSVISPSAQSNLGDRVYSILSQIDDLQLGNTRITFGPGQTRFYPGSAPEQHSANAPEFSPAANPPFNKKVYLLVYNPILSNGQDFNSFMGWTPYSALVQDVISSFQAASHGQLNYQIAYTKVITDHWPVKIDGFRYDEAAYLAAYENRTPHAPNDVNYDAIVGDPQFDICGKLNRGEIDELWIYGGPYDGFYESRLVGPGGYWFNSPPMDITHGCTKLLPIMGLNYERGVAEAMHSFGHRAESSMTQVYGSWNWPDNRTSHNWERFTLVIARSPDYSYSGCGYVHFPPNGVTDYDYANPSVVLTNCEDFRNYPNLSHPESVAQPIDCTAWNCDHLDYMVYWFGHLPYNPSCANDWVANNWWQYFADANFALDPAAPCSGLSSFQDVPFNYWAFDWIERLYANDITGGCALTPLQYCPEGTVTRAQMAVFLLRGIHTSSYAPPGVDAGTGFGDVPPDYWSAAWIKQLAAEGITSGCGNGNFCPEHPVTRAQMAVFLLRSKYGAAYTPPAVGASTGFGDVPPDYWSAAWIKQLVTEGITTGCGNGNYCPENPVTRAQMAVFLVRTFNLP